MSMHSSGKTLTPTVSVFYSVRLNMSRSVNLTVNQYIVKLCLYEQNESSCSAVKTLRVSLKSEWTGEMLCYLLNRNTSLYLSVNFQPLKCYKVKFCFLC